VKEIYSLPLGEQAERFRALFQHLDQQYMELVATYHLLVPAWSLQTLIDRFKGTERVSGFELVRHSLLDSAILIITKLLRDGDDTNPSLLTMVRPFLSGNRQRHADLLRILEHDYADRGMLLSPEWRQGLPDWAIKQLQEQDQKDAEVRRKEFWERADTIATDWPKLAQASEKFLEVRNKWIAHLEVEYDPVAKEYKPLALPSLLEIYLGLKDVVPTITQSVSHLAGLFEGLDISTEQFAEMAKGHALAFWEIPEPSA
jgi:AbiU2